MKQKIAIINQRYGLEVNGGSELYTRMISERLNETYDVEVLTTCALDYTTWENYYNEGLGLVNHVKVRRFPVDRERDPEKFSQFTEYVMNHKNVQESDYERWIDDQGPYCPQLIHYLENNQSDYKVMIVVTYLYYVAARSIPIVAHKTIFIPTAHDEPFLHFPPYKDCFSKARAFVFLTEEEQQLVINKFKIGTTQSEVMGVGVDLPANVNGLFKEEHGLEEYLIYVGRIDEGKNCSQMFQYFLEYKKRNPGRLKLVLMGKSVIQVPVHEDIINMGFVSEEEKFSGISSALAMVMPSKFESLSISVLEAMSMGVPVLVNGACEVLKGHCVKSNGGFYYLNYFEFEGCINYMLSHKQTYKWIGSNARGYIETYFNWEVIMKKFDDMIANIIGTAELDHS